MKKSYSKILDRIISSLQGRSNARFANKPFVTLSSPSESELYNNVPLLSVETKTFPADVISHAVAKRLVASVVK